MCASWKSTLGSASGLCSVLSPRAPTVTPARLSPRPLGSPIAPGHRAEGAQECQAGVFKDISPHGGTQRDQNAFNVV